MGGREEKMGRTWAGLEGSMRGREERREGRGRDLRGAQGDLRVGVVLMTLMVAEMTCVHTRDVIR